MAIHGISINRILVLYRLTKQHRLSHPGRCKDGWESSNGGSSITRKAAEDALRSKKIPSYFVVGKLSADDRRCVFDALRQWIDGAASPIHAE